jgi:hypothetical protein
MLSSVCIPFIIPLPSALERSAAHKSKNEQINNVSFGTSQQYAAALAKPLFHLNRLPPKPKPAAAPKPVEKIRIEAPFTVVGIIASGTGFNAYLVNTETGNTQVATKRGVLNDWTVEEVTQTYVIMSLGTEKRTLRLE